MSDDNMTDFDGILDEGIAFDDSWSEEDDERTKAFIEERRRAIAALDEQPIDKILAEIAQLNPDVSREDMDGNARSVGKPTIVLDLDEALVIEQLWEALRGRVGAKRLFVRAQDGQMVILRLLHRRLFDGSTLSTCELEPVDVERLACILSGEVLSFVMGSAGKPKYKPIPRRLLGMMLAEPADHLPVVTSFCNYAFFSRLGHYMTSGDDESWHLRCPLPYDQVLPVPEAPTDDEIREAGDTIASIIENLGLFLDDSDMAGFLGCIIACMARELVEGPVPLFVIRGETAEDALFAVDLLRVLLGSMGEVDVSQLRSRLVDDLLRGRLAGHRLFQLHDLEHADKALPKLLRKRTWCTAGRGEPNDMVMVAAIAQGDELPTELAGSSVLIRIASSRATTYRARARRRLGMAKHLEESRSRLWQAVAMMVRASWAEAIADWTRPILRGFEEACGFIGQVLDTARLVGWLESFDDEFYSQSRAEDELETLLRAWFNRYGSSSIPVASVLDIANELDVFDDITKMNKQHAAKIRLGLLLGRRSSDLVVDGIHMAIDKHSRRDGQYYKLTGPDGEDLPAPLRVKAAVA